MYFELNRHPAQVPRTKIEFLGGLISDLEHCALGFLAQIPSLHYYTTLEGVLGVQKRELKEL